MGPLEQARPIHDQFVVSVDGMVAHGRLVICFGLIVVVVSYAVVRPNAPTNTVSKKEQGRRLVTISILTCLFYHTIY
jgi:hypothetical protein